MKKFTTLGLAGLMLFGGTALFAGDNVEENMASTPELLKRWGSSQFATLLPTGGPKGKPAIRIASGASDANRQIQYKLDLDKVRGKVIELSADVKAENVSQPPKHYLGVKMMIVITKADGTRQYVDITTGKSGSYEWRECKVKAAIPTNAKEVAISLGLQSAMGAVYFSDIDVEIDD